VPASFVWIASRDWLAKDAPTYVVAPLPPNHELPNDAGFWSRELNEVQQWVAAENARLTDKRGGKIAKGKAA
jgi:hypothetical protein